MYRQISCLYFALVLHYLILRSIYVSPIHVPLFFFSPALPNFAFLFMYRQFMCLYFSLVLHYLILRFFMYCQFMCRYFCLFLHYLILRSIYVSPIHVPLFFFNPALTNFAIYLCIANSCASIFQPA